MASSTKRRGPTPVFAPLLLLCLCLCLCFCTAPVISQDEISFNFEHFEEIDRDLYFVSVSDTSHQSGNYFQLTSPAPNKAGALWYKTPVYFRGMQTTFEINITNGNYTTGPAQGIAFVLQTEGINATIGGFVGGMGYAGRTSDGTGGIKKSLAIEFDCARNTDLNDPTNRHISIHSMGSDPNNADETHSLGQYTNPSNFCNGKTKLTVKYEPGMLLVYMEGFTEPLLSVPLHVEEYIDIQSTGKSYIGFTATTGVESGVAQSILSWSFNFLGVITAGKTIATGDGLNGGVAGYTLSFSILGHDQYGNPMMYGGAHFEINLIGVASLPYQDLGNGTYQVYYNRTISGQYQLEILLDGVGIYGSPFNVEIVADVIDPDHSQLCGSSLPSELEVAIQNTVMVCGYDQYNNKILTGDEASVISASLDPHYPTDHIDNIQDNNDGSYSVKFTVYKAIFYALYIKIHNQDVAGTPLEFTSFPGPVSGSNCHVEGVPSQPIVAGVGFSLTIRTYDAYNNPLTEGGATIILSLAPNYSENTVDPVQDNNDGSYAVNILMTIAGNYKLNIRISNQDVADAPYDISVNPTDFSPFHSLINGKGYTQGIAGIQSSFTIQARDEYENNITQSVGDVVTVTVVGVDVNKNTTADVTDNSDGSYYVYYTIMESGNYLTYAFAEDTLIGDTEPGKTVINPNDFDASKSYVLDPEYKFTSTQVEITTWLQVQVTDSYGNHLSYGGMTMNVDIIPESEKIDPIESNVHDHSNGTYTITFTPLKKQKGKFTMSIIMEGSHIKDSPFEVTVHDYETSNIIAIAVGCSLMILCIILVVGLVYYRRWKKKNEYQRIMENR